MGKKSFDIFDFNNDGKVDPLERDLGYAMMAYAINEQEEEERRQQEQMDRELDELMDEIFSTPDVSGTDDDTQTVSVDDIIKELELEQSGLDKTDLLFMDDLEREEVLFEAGLNPDDYCDLDFL